MYIYILQQSKNSNLCPICNWQGQKVWKYNNMKREVLLKLILKWLCCVQGAIQDITEGWDIQVPSQVPIDAAFTLEESVYFFKVRKGEKFTKKTFSQKKDYFTWREAVPHISPSEVLFISNPISRIRN